MDRDDHDGEIEFATRPLLCCTSSNTYISCINREGGYASLFSIHALGPQFCWWRSPNLRSTFHSKMRFLFWQLGPLPIHVGTVVTFCFFPHSFLWDFFWSSSPISCWKLLNGIRWMEVLFEQNHNTNVLLRDGFYDDWLLTCNKLMNWFLVAWHEKKTPCISSNRGKFKM